MGWIDESESGQERERERERERKREREREREKERERASERGGARDGCDATTDSERREAKMRDQHFLRPRPSGHQVRHALIRVIK
jgi:hypothetical protein